MKLEPIDFAAKVEGHPETKDCKDDECMICGYRDCPHNEPLHYHHDGCPACIFEEPSLKDKLKVAYCLNPDVDFCDKCAVCKNTDNILDGMMEDVEVLDLAEFMHDEYEKNAKEVGWKTQESCQVKFMDLPTKNREVMYNIAKKVLERFFK